MLGKSTLLGGLLLVLGATSPLGALPGAYLVFELRGGAPEPLFYREVELRSLDRADSEHGSYQARLVGADGRALAPARVHHVPARLEGPGPDGRLTTFAGAENELLVVRAPRLPGARLELRGAGERAGADTPGGWSFELDRLADEAGDLPLAAFAAGDAGGERAFASAANRVDLLVMGDGFVAESTFAAAASRALGQFFDLEPYDSYRDYFQVETLFTPSAENGADHPPYRADCPQQDATCCPELVDDPRYGTFANTAFDARFCANGSHRLLVVRYAPVYAAASARPDWDIILVVVNDPVYGGSGGEIGVFSDSPSAVFIAQHEFGHSFTGLADEYDTAYPGFPPCSDEGAGEVSGGGCEANVTDRANPVKWARWIAGGTPIPTPESSGYHGTGLFQGARYQPSTMYRPKDTQCAMHFLERPFCEVCREAFVRRLYQGGWGEPAGGLSLIEGASPGGGSVAASAPLDLSVDVLQSRRGHQVEWRVDGVLRQQGGSTLFRFAPGTSGVYQVEARVRDVTDFVHPDFAADLEQRRSWTVTYTGLPAAGTLAFAVAGAQIAEDAGVAQVRVERTGGSAGAVGVSYAASGGSATAGVDFTAVAGELSWPDGDAGPRFFAVPILDDTLGEDHEMLALALSAPTGGATLGRAAATLEIRDDEPLVCTPDAHTLCLGEGRRFQVRVGWKDFQGAQGPGSTWEIGKRDSGLFFFFDENNIELLVKALDGCGINQRFWLFYAATTNVEFELQVLDTVTRERKVYRNPLGQDAPPVLDTDAFSICP